GQGTGPSRLVSSQRNFAGRVPRGDRLFLNGLLTFRTLQHISESLSFSRRFSDGRTSNIQRRTSNKVSQFPIGSWMFDVRCSMLNVFLLFNSCRTRLSDTPPTPQEEARGHGGLFVIQILDFLQALWQPAAVGITPQ